MEDDKSVKMSLLKDLSELLLTPIRLPGHVKSHRERIRRQAIKNLKRSAATRKMAAPGNKKSSGSSYSLEGTVQRGKLTPFAIDSEDFEVGPETFLIGELEVGAQASVRITPVPGEVNVASKVQIIKSASGR